MTSDTSRPGSPDRTESPLAAALRALIHDQAWEPSALSTEDEGLVRAMAPWLSLLSSSPDADDADLESDPVAIALGLVVDPSQRLSGSRLRTARRDASMKTSELAGRLIGRGWPVQTRDISYWERSETAIYPALLAAVCEEVGAKPDSLVLTSERRPDRSWAAVFEDQDVVAALSEWSVEAGISVEQTQEVVTNKLSLAAFRNQHVPTTAAVLAVIKIVRRVGTGGDGSRGQTP
jgi:hypothetical protein